MIAYVINLKKDSDRWEDIQKEFKNSSIKLKRIDAVKDSVGAYGLVQSFINVLKLARKNRLKNVLILEDDCKLTPNWESNWDKITKWLDENPNKWDIYSGSGWNILFPNLVGEIDNKIAIFDPMISWTTNWLYIPSRNYDSLIKKLNSVKHYIKNPLLHYFFVLDNFLNICCKFVVSYPFMAYQNDKYNSNIEQGILTKKLKISRFAVSEKYLKKQYLTYKKNNPKRNKTIKYKKD
jgi:hypothetical protein